MKMIAESVNTNTTSPHRPAMGSSTHARATSESFSRLRFRFLGMKIGTRVIREPRFYSVAGADAVSAPLADDFVEVRAHRIDHRALAAAVAVRAFRFALRSPAGAIVHDGIII